MDFHKITRCGVTVALSCTTATQVANVLDDGGHLKNYVNEFCDISPPLNKDDNGYWSEDSHLLHSDDEKDTDKKCLPGDDEHADEKDFATRKIVIDDDDSVTEVTSSNTEATRKIVPGKYAGWSIIMSVSSGFAEPSLLRRFDLCVGLT